MKVKVVCVFGEFKEGKDFVLEKACPDKCDCEICKNAFWIEEAEE